MDYDSEEEINQRSELEMRSLALSLPSVPTHPVGRPVRLSREDEYKAAMEEKVAYASDDGDSSASDTEGKSSKKRKKAKTESSGGRQRSQAKILDHQADELINALQTMHQRGSTTEDAQAYISSLSLDPKKIAGLKTSLLKFMQLSNKASTATEIAMMKHLSSLQNDHPDRVLEESIRAMTYRSLQKSANETEDAIVMAELEVKRLKHNLRIQKFFLEVHPEKTQDREMIIQFCHQQLSAIESRMFEEALTKTSARKMFAQRAPLGPNEIEI